MKKKDIVQLLSGREMSDEQLFAEARAKRERVFGKDIILRGVLEITNLCRVNCDFCPMRRDNTRGNATFTLTSEDIMLGAKSIKAAGLNIVFMQGGEVSQTTALVENVIPSIQKLFNNSVEILLNLGNKTRDEYARLKHAGALSYIIKHETSNPLLYRRFKHESFEKRVACINDLLDLGYKVGTGSIIGLPGQSMDDIADDILFAEKIGAHMVSASPFVPALNTPLENEASGSVLLTQRVIAITRLALPHVLIPSVSALEANQDGGQEGGLNAGANVLTANFTPVKKQKDYLIYGANRFIVKLQRIRELLESAGLQPAKSRWII